MRISEAKQCIMELYRNTDSVIALVSERGVGKTSAFQQCTCELGIGYMGLYAAAMEGPDFMGLPDKDREKGITRYLAPQFLPTLGAVREGIFPENGLLVLEEINRVPTDTISVLYPLLLERKINGHSLAPGWKIGVTMNPDTLNYAVNSLDDAMLDRFTTIEITANLEDYITYSLNNGPCDDVLSYLIACPDMLLRVKKAADSTATAKSPTPRGWTRVQQFLNNCSLPEKLMQELISGILGPEAAASFFGYLKNREYTIPSANELLNDYGKVRPQFEKLVQGSRLDLLGLVMKKTVSLLDGSDNQCRNINSMLSELPEEFQLVFFKTLATDRPELFLNVAQQTSVFAALSDQILDLLA
jgi:hypothetical protein